MPSKLRTLDLTVSRFRTNPRAPALRSVLACYRGTCDVVQREDRFRAMAAQCFEMAATTTDSAARVRLLIMAQRWLEMAGETFGDRLFNALIDDFNDRQMVDALKA